MAVNDAKRIIRRLENGQDIFDIADELGVTAAQVAATLRDPVGSSALAPSGGGGGGSGLSVGLPTERGVTPTLTQDPPTVVVPVTTPCLVVAELQTTGALSEADCIATIVYAMVLPNGETQETFNPESSDQWVHGSYRAFGFHDVSSDRWNSSPGQLVFPVPAGASYMFQANIPAGSNAGLIHLFETAL